MNQKQHSNLSLTIKVGAFMAGIALIAYYGSRFIESIF